MGYYKEQRELRLVFNDAAQRYAYFREEYPGLENQIPQYHIESRLKKILIDKGYRGSFVEYALEQLDEVEIEVPTKPPGCKGFIPEAKRWVIERTFGTFNFFRRLVIDYERSPRCAESMIFLANIAMNLKRIK